MRTAFLSLIVCVAGSKQDNRFSESPHIVDMLQTLCPGADVCSRNQTSDEQSKPFAFSTTSCCTGKVVYFLETKQLQNITLFT